MQNITVTLYVDPATAAREGHATCGATSLELTDAYLAQLTETQREALADHLAKEDGLVPGGYRIGHADGEVLKYLLGERVRQQEQAAAEQREQEARREAAAQAWLEATKSLPAVETQVWLAGGVETYLRIQIPPLRGVKYAHPEVSKRYGELTEENDRRFRAAKQRLREAIQAARDRIVREYAQPAFRARYAAGYAGEQEVNDLICQIELETLPPGFESLDNLTSDLDQLTDAEFEALDRMKKVLDVSPVIRHGYRPATPEEIDEGLADEDGEVSMDARGVLVERELPGAYLRAFCPFERV